MERKRLAVVSPIYDGYPEAKQDLQDLMYSIERGATDIACDVILSMDSCHRIFEAEARTRYPRAIILNHKGNRKNFCGNANEGLREAYKRGYEGVLLVNQDTILPIWHLLKRLTQSPFTGLCSARSMSFKEEISLDNRLSGLGFKTDGSELNPMETRFAGFCYYYPRNVMEKVGFLDEHSFKAGFDDDDLIVRCLLAGFTCGTVDVWVEHKGSHINQEVTGASRSGAYGIRDGSLGLHLDKFLRKWSVPANVGHAGAQDWILKNFQWDKELMYCE